MPKTRNLIGERFGKLLVLEKMPTLENRYYTWRCKCDCGGEIIVNTKRLTRGTVTNCGCVPKTKALNGRIAEDLTGRRFGKLVAVKRMESKNTRTKWLCLCDCGNQVIVNTHELKAGKTKSCGCHRKYELTHNRADIHDQKFGRLTALYPTEKRDVKGSVYWHCRCDCGNELDVTEDGLVHGNYRSCGCWKKEIQESIKEQLTFVDNTCIEWLSNRKTRSDNTSGFRGVYKTANGKWRAGIGLQGKRYHVGTFSTFEEAAFARLEVEKCLHGGFVKAYHAWAEKAQENSEWADAHPFYFRVFRYNGKFYTASVLDEEKKQLGKNVLAIG